MPAVDDRLIAPAVLAVGRSAVAVGDKKQSVQRGDVQQYLSAAITAVVVALVLILVAVST